MALHVRDVKDLKRMRKRVYQQMLETRGWKYRSFLRYLRLFKYAAFAPTRGSFLESYYVLMRYLDDIVDGDIPVPEGYASESAYISEKISFSLNPVHPNDEADHMLLYCFELAKRFHENFQEETADILNSLLFDAKRRGKMTIFSRSELEHHFHLLDIRGTIKATLKIFKDNPEKYLLLEPLGTACRYQYDIEDIEADLAAGYVNIPREDCEELGIEPTDLMDASSPKIREWLYKHAQEGLKLLEEHRRLLPEGNFSLLEKYTFLLVYELPARKVFQKFISETKLEPIDHEKIKYSSE
ncbi:squalene/phytoene synthase [Christiangramia gaetbulicola]|uniref:Squalene/phytoene synthase n=1 Tax=Christiangramia gaetbulicola TaxID=703340 RepID=A0A2T6ALZ3_9FLAO|nr:class 1 isoprenoid biosynthesis enzyme [Christiangramia gaetbulicola]PTX44807.1 squalene/phytoene synthase [Christiangramia gaetbulicola]